MIQLGHRGPSCPRPGPIQKDFTIVDLSGIHTIDVRFCACHDTPGGSAHHIQLLRFCYFPSTITRPQSAFTFDVLNTFHLLTLKGKVSAYDFYCVLQHKTDNTGISDVKVRTHWLERLTHDLTNVAILSAIPYRHPPVAPSQVTEAIWSWTRSRWC